MTRAEYEQYLLSDHWLDFSRKMKVMRGKCELCGISPEDAMKKHRNGLNVHHKTYKNIGKEKPEDVIVVCRKCHQEKHGMAGWQEFCTSFAMPEAKPVGYVSCVNCGKGTSIKIWNRDQLPLGRNYVEWYCEDCR